MERMPASQKMRKDFEEVTNGTNMAEFLLSGAVEREAGIVLQEMLEAEVTDFLGCTQGASLGGTWRMP